MFSYMCICIIILILNKNPCKHIILHLQIFKQLYVAAIKYVDWKTKNKPDYKPWRKPEQSSIPLVSVVGIVLQLKSIKSLCLDVNTLHTFS